MEKAIFGALIDLVSLLNRPDRDKKMILNAGVNLEPATFKVFGGIVHLQPTSVGDLADMMGKNYSSVSRQIDKLESAGLVRTYPSETDSRIRISELTEYGEEIHSKISQTRERIMQDALSDWSPAEKQDLLDNLRRLFEAMHKVD
jgi:DNA-binding MarR family transcriptional regulator